MVKTMIDRETLHIESYSRFRNYLDLAYADSDTLSLSMGYPEPGEFPLPKCILHCLSVEKNGVEKLRPGYGWNAGSLELRNGVIELENLLHNTCYTIKNICMVAGATYAFNRIVEYIFCNKQNFMKDFIIVAPTYYRMTDRASKFAHVISVVGKEENSFQVTADELIEVLSDDTKAIFLANPTNPTYIYYSMQFFERIVPELEKRGIYLIIDESGDAFNLGLAQKRLKRFDAIIGHKNVIRIVTASKKYLFAEYRIGYVLASEEFMGNKYDGYIKLIGDDIGNAPLATNEALIKIMELEKRILCNEYSSEAEEYDNRMNDNNKKMIELKRMAVQRLQSMTKITNIIMPDSNFNITFKISSTNYNKDIEFFKAFLKEKKVSILPCSGLGLSETDMYFRVTYGINKNDLMNGLTCLEDFLRNEE